MNEKPLWRLIAGRKAGPYEPAKLRPLVKDGRIGPLDRFSYDGVAWGPATDFQELFRPPAVPVAAADTSVTLDPLDSDSVDIGIAAPIHVDLPAVGKRSAPRGDLESIDDAKLIKAISTLIAFGGGMFVLLIGYIVIASMWGPASPGPAPAARSEQDAAPAESRPAAAIAVDQATRPPSVTEDGDERPPVIEGPEGDAAGAADPEDPAAEPESPAAEPVSPAEPAGDRPSKAVTEPLE